MVMHDSVKCQAVATTLAVPGLRWSVDLDLGGQAPCHLVGLAASAIATGQAGRRRALPGDERPLGLAGRHHGVRRSGRAVALPDRVRRVPHVRGDVGPALPRRDRPGRPTTSAPSRWPSAAYAEANERAVRRRPLSAADHAAAPIVVSPFRADDCTIEVDGACALVVTSLDRARDARHAPVVVASSEYRAGPRSGLDIGDHLLWDDYTRNYTSILRDDLFARAGRDPGRRRPGRDLRLLLQHRAHGTRRARASASGAASGAFVRSGATRLDGALPVNTHGGLLAEGYLHGMNTVCEAVLQVQGRGGRRQAPRHEVCAVTSGALMDGSALVLTTDR